MKKLKCPHCGFPKVLGGRELRTFRKRLSGFTCTKCGEKVSAHDLAKKRGSGPKPKEERRKRIKKEVVKEKPKPIVPQPYVERPEWRPKPLQPTERTLEEAVITSLNIRVSAPIPTPNLEVSDETTNTRIGEYLSDTRVEASSSGGSLALAMIGPTQQETTEEEVLTEELPGELDMILHFGFRFLFFFGLRIDLFDTVKHLPKNARRLNRMQTKYLKEQLEERDGYDKIKRFGTVFVEFSALEHKSYGNVLYFSAGTNPWERVYRVTVNDIILLKMKEPVRKVRGWGKSIYDPIIDRFIELGHDLVEIGVEDKKPGYVAFQLRRRIKDRGLEIIASSIGDFVYLENNNRM